MEILNDQQINKALTLIGKNIQLSDGSTATISRWTKNSKDRLYINVESASSAGYIDLQTNGINWLTTKAKFHRRLVEVLDIIRSSK